MSESRPDPPLAPKRSERCWHEIGVPRGSRPSNDTHQKCGQATIELTEGPIWVVEKSVDRGRCGRLKSKKSGPAAARAANVCFLSRRVDVGSRGSSVLLLFCSGAPHFALLPPCVALCFKKFTLRPRRPRMSFESIKGDRPVAAARRRPMKAFVCVRVSYPRGSKPVPRRRNRN